jgi:hypothetical protein
VPNDLSLYLAIDFGLEQPPRSSYADLSSYMPYMSHLSTWNASFPTTSPKAKKFRFKLVKGISLNHLYNAYNTMGLYSLLGLFPSLMNLEAPEKRCLLASSSLRCFSPLDIYSNLPFGSPKEASLSNIFETSNC